MASLEALGRVLPILLLVGLGVLLRRSGLIRASTVDDLRELILTLTLPATLFLAFLRAPLEPGYAVVIAGVFGACIAVLMTAPAVCRMVRVQAPTARFLMAGFEAGMLGYAIYGAVFGAAAIHRLFQAAVMTMAILPPPFVVPLYLARSGRPAGRASSEVYLSNTLSLATIATLVAVTIVAAVYAT